MPIAGQCQRGWGRGGEMHKKQRCHEMPKGLGKKICVSLCIGKGELILIAPSPVLVQWKALANY